MLKKRIIPTLLYRDTTLVKGVGFDSWRRVGSVMQAVKVYNMRQVDELVFLDITATLNGREVDFELIDELADECFMPLTVGGGVRHVDQVRQLLMVGADKVAVNTAVIERPEIISEISENFGRQCCVASIDCRKTDSGWIVYTRSGTQNTNLDPVSVAKTVERLGAGEILLTSIDRDGTMEGYDIELISAVSKSVNIPVIASGGAGSFADMDIAFKVGGASAVAAASIFHFTELTPREANLALSERGHRVRI
jgi:cyclase